MNPILRALGRRLRLGVVGGGPGSFIGPVHRAAARLDDRYELTAGVLSSNPQRSRAAAADLGIARAYGDWREMAAAEAARDDGVEVVAIMTPNAGHHPAAAAFLDAGVDVICDKPLTTGVADALDLVARVAASGLVFCTTYNYSAYPMVRQARAMVKDGAVGEVLQAHATYVQGYFVPGAERAGWWKLDAAQTGPSLVLGDIGTHAEHLLRYVTGLELERVLADVGASVPGRVVDDYGAVLLRFAGGARGSIWVTNAAPGAEHGLGFRVFGSEGGLEWRQEYPNELLHRRRDDFPRTLTRRLDGSLCAAAERASRVEIGHPEGYQEAFANLYRDVAEAVLARRTGTACDPLALDFPTVRDGAAGVAFVEAAKASSDAGGWVDCALAG